MNSAEKRRQKKLAKKAAKKGPPAQSPDQQTLTIPQALALALQHHTQGRLPEAEGLYQQILQNDPEQPIALQMLGVIAHQVGKNDIAVNFITGALAINPDDAEAHNNLGTALENLGKLDKAVTSYRQALVLKPDFAKAHYNLGNALGELGQPEDAVASYQKAIDIKPDYTEAHCNLGNTLGELGKLDEAVECFSKALAIIPDLAVAHNNLGNVLKNLNKPEDAVASYQKALAINSEYVEALNNFGTALKDLGQLDEAVASYQKAIAINPDYAEAHNNLGTALEALGKMDMAVASYRQALVLKPDYAKVHNNLGNTFKERGELDEAVASYQKALDINPDDVEARNNLGAAFKELGQLDEAVASFQKALAIKSDYLVAGKNLLFVLLNVPGLTPKELFAEHLRFAENHTLGIARPAEALTNDPTPDRRLRVGYLSSDFGDHAVGMNLLPLLSSHDRTAFEIFCYADVPRPDAVTEQFRSAVDHWRPIAGKPDSEVAGMVRADAIDVLVCLAGRFGNNRPLVCAWRAAPVQVSFHDGATSGLEEMDYWLTDSFLHPPDTREMFTEQLRRLPVFYQYPPISTAPPVGALPSEQAGSITFGSFNNPAKVNEDVIRLWSEVLKSVPGSQLLLKYKNWYGQASLQDGVSEKFAACGIGLDRVEFRASRDSLAEHLGCYDEVDIALDTFPFNGATTTFQALWMGVPVVSLAGETFINRAAGSILYHAGFGELAIKTPEAYVDSARNLAGDLARLRSLREGLRERLVASPLCNAPAYARSIETTYRDMWRKWCEQSNGNTDHLL